MSKLKAPLLIRFKKSATNWLNALGSHIFLFKNSKAVDLIVVFPIILYLCLALPQLTLPGLSDDEAREAGLPAMQMLTGQPVTVIGNVTYYGLPLMTNHYNGAIHAYYIMPWLLIGGISVTSLRLGYIAIGVFTLQLTYWVGQELFTRRSSIVTTFFLASLPNFVFWSRQGALPGLLVLPFTLGAVWCAIRWWKNKQLMMAALTGLCTGLSLYTKLLAVWFLLPAVLLGGICYRREIQQAWNTCRKRVLWGLLLVFVFGLIPLVPLIIYNHLSDWQSFKFMLGNSRTTFYGVHNTQVFINILLRIKQSIAVTSGSLTHRFFDFGTSHANSISSALFVFSLSTLPLSNTKNGRWLFGVVVLMVILSSFTVSGFWPFHLILHLPWFALVVGTILDNSLSISVRQKRLPVSVLQGVITIVLVMTLVGNVLGTIAYHSDLTHTGGRWYSNAAIYSLADYLESTYDDEPLFAVDWGISPAVAFLTKGAVQPDEAVGVLVENNLLISSYIMAFLENDKAIFITHSAPYEAFPVRELLLDILRKEKSLVYTVHIINNYQREPFFEVYEVSIIDR